MLMCRPLRFRTVAQAVMQVFSCVSIRSKNCASICNAGDSSYSRLFLPTVDRWHAQGEDNHSKKSDRDHHREPCCLFYSVNVSYSIARVRLPIRVAIYFREQGAPLFCSIHHLQVWLLSFFTSKNTYKKPLVLKTPHSVGDLLPRVTCDGAVNTATYSVHARG